MLGSPLPSTSHSEDGFPVAVFSHATRLTVAGLSRHAGPGNDWLGGNGRSGGGGGGGGGADMHAANSVTEAIAAKSQRDPDLRVVRLASEAFLPMHHAGTRAPTSSLARAPLLLGARGRKQVTPPRARGIARAICSATST